MHFIFEYRLHKCAEWAQALDLLIPEEQRDEVQEKLEEWYGPDYEIRAREA